MAMPRRNLNGEAGAIFAHLHAFTLADYSAAGTTGPAVGDLVTISATGNWFVKLIGNDVTKRMGRIAKIELAAVSTATGYAVVEWFDAERVVELDSDDATTVTLANSAIKDGDTTVVNNVDAGATTGPLVVVSKSAATGAIKVYALVFGA